MVNTALYATDLEFWMMKNDSIWKSPLQPIEGKAKAEASFDDNEQKSEKRIRHFLSSLGLETASFGEAQHIPAG